MMMMKHTTTDKFSTNQGTFLYLLLSGLRKDVPTPTNGVPPYLSVIRENLNSTKSMNVELSLSLVKNDLQQCGYSLSFAPHHLFDKYSDGKDERVGRLLKSLTLKEMELVLVELSKERKRVGRLWELPTTHHLSVEVDEDGSPLNIRTLLQRKEK